jgi:general secretion pathway protein I
VTRGARPPRAHPTPAPAGAREGQAGFTLFEVLIALVVLAVAVTAVLQLLGGGLRLARASADHVGATLLASVKLSEVPPGALEEEEVTGEEGTYRWSRRVALVPELRPVEPSEPKEDTVRLAQVTVEVRWGTNRRVEMVTLRTWGVKP